MQARLRRFGDVSVIEISGALTIEETQPFRESCAKRFSKQKIVFNMRNASFVGSTGIQAFLETLQDLESSGQHGVRLVGVRSEFRRMISSLESKKIEFFEDENVAVKDWLRPCAPDSGDDSALD